MSILYITAHYLSQLNVGTEYRCMCSLLSNILIDKSIYLYWSRYKLCSIFLKYYPNFKNLLHVPLGGILA